MLTETAYRYALYFYVGGGGLFLFSLVYFAKHLIKSNFIFPLLLFLCALILTPAYPSDGIKTMAPAVIVYVFQVFIHGPDSAEHALRPLALGFTLAAIISGFSIVIRRIFSSRTH